MPIKVLPPDLANKIAAGEVIERPASVVKELVENSLDAGATRIVVEVAGGGTEKLRVTDDGEGITPAELETAFARHATSKLQTQEQLDAIATLGFRGEALPSIAAVSRLTMTTRPHQAGAGPRIALDWGNVSADGPQGCPVGTSVEVADLFGNMPARRKFLKSNSTETGRVQELVARYALAYPSVAFQMVNEGRRLLTSSGNGQPRETLLAVYGAEAAEDMLEIHGEDPENGYDVDGFISAPNLHRSNRTYMAFFVNRRWIQSRMLSFALEEAYHGLLPERRFPMAAINLTVPYGEVDVNSHPAKREVRFHQEGKVFSALQKTVRAALIADSPVPQLQSPSAPSTRMIYPPSGNQSYFPKTVFSGQQQEAFSGPVDAAAPVSAAPPLKVVGQVKLTYIVAEGSDGMFLVDQHAAHERILFDRIQAKDAGEQPAESLLEPAMVDLSPAQVEVLQKNSETLTRYGYRIESFGANAYLVRAVPSILSDQDPAQGLLNVLDMVAFEGLLRQQEDVLAASIACHSAIRAGKSLSDAEMRSLLEQLEATTNPHTCPHGRPTMLHFSSFHMEREFGRR
ncbi:MAG: DNA mismatch repair endonuclease MutL [Chloroflexota bacterium]|nr:DNA mismatch repair endonuclease MutL [Chloroflexota bacterium]